MLGRCAALPLPRNKPWASFTLASGQLVTAERIDVGKPAPGRFVAPIDVWVSLKPDRSRADR